MITKSDAIYPKIFDKRNFMYLDSNDELNYYTKVCYFDISDDKYTEVMNHIKKYDMCYICRLESGEDFSGIEITDENLIGMMLSVSDKINVNGDEHNCVEFAVLVEETIEEKQVIIDGIEETYITRTGKIKDINDGDRLVLFYFEEDDPFNNKVFISESEFTNV